MTCGKDIDPSAEEKKETALDSSTDKANEDRRAVIEMLTRRVFNTAWLYDAKGSQLYENITKQPEYYLTPTEAALIAEKSCEIVPWGTSRHILLELGAGVGEKVHPMLPAMKSASPHQQFVYAPVDCDGWALEQNRERLEALYPDVECEIKVGLYEDMLEKTFSMAGEKTILFLGSTLGNFSSTDEATEFVKMVKSFMKRGDRLIIGVDTPPQDGLKSLDYVHDAYRKSTGGHREEFIMNGLDHAGRRGGVDWNRDLWKRVTEWNEQECSVLHYVEALEDHVVRTAPEAKPVAFFKAGERVKIANHTKYSPDKLRGLIEDAGLVTTRHWMPANNHWCWMESVLPS